MIRLRKAEERGSADFGWLKARYTFSFARYYDPAHMGFRSLRVMNEDRVAPGSGFPTHPHDNMEIITIVLEGAIRHTDSMGHTEVLRPGEVQAMSAGTGIEHSEVNPSYEEPLHLYQIWLEPNVRNVEPRYQQQPFDPDARRNRWQLLVSPNGEEGSLRIHQDAKLYATILDEGGSTEYPLAAGRAAWVQVIRGRVRLPGGETLETSDGAAIEDESLVALTAEQESELLLFDLA